MIAVLAGTMVGLDVAALGPLFGAVVAGYVSARMVGPNRRKVIEETATSATERATAALERALDRYEKYNARLLEEVNALEDSQDELEQRLATALERARTLTEERDELLLRVRRLVERYGDHA